MSPPSLISVLWLLCMLAAVANVAGGSVRRIDGLWIVLAFGLVLALAHGRSLDPSWIGLCVGLSAGILLFAPPPEWVRLAVAGALSALASNLYISQGANEWIVAPACFGLIALVFALAYGGRYASSPTQTALLVLLGLAAPVVAAAPGILSGWQSAQALNQSGHSGATPAIPALAWQFVAGSLFLGVIHGLWARR
jgi:zinc transporter ZupT